MFEKLSRRKARFETPQGYLCVEDLWDLPLIASAGRANLDDIAKSLNQKLKASETESFVRKNPIVDETLQLQFDVVKHIINVKLKEQEEAELRLLNKEKKQKLLSIIASKENEQLMGSSLEELRQMAEQL